MSLNIFNIIKENLYKKVLKWLVSVYDTWDYKHIVLVKLFHSKPYVVVQANNVAFAAAIGKNYSLIVNFMLQMLLKINRKFSIASKLDGSLLSILVFHRKRARFTNTGFYVVSLPPPLQFNHKSFVVKPLGVISQKAFLI